MIGKSEGTDGRDVLFVLSRICSGGIEAGAYAALKPGIEDGSRVLLSSTDIDDFLSPLMPPLTQAAALWIKIIECASSERVLLGLRSAAKDIWYLKLKALRTASFPLKGLQSSEHCQTIIRCWIKLGEALGLSESVERLRHDAQRARLCSWALCAHHKTPAEQALSLCKGCGEVRYCSRECQRRWVIWSVQLCDRPDF